MTITKTKINFEDGRGIIRDILTHTDFDACTYITFTPGAVRANHYHAKTIQYDYILSGKLEVYSRNGFEGEIIHNTIEAGDTIKFEAGVHHGYKALENCEMLSFTKGPRQGDEYESDTFRLEGDEKLVQ